jgi:hypothetical protein
MVYVDIDNENNKKIQTNICIKYHKKAKNWQAGRSNNRNNAELVEIMNRLNQLLEQ